MMERGGGEVFWGDDVDGDGDDGDNGGGGSCTPNWLRCISIFLAM
jgi:hypothetical protein